MQEINSLELDFVSGGDATENPYYPKTETDEIRDHDWTKKEEQHR